MSVARAKSPHFSTPTAAAATAPTPPNERTYSQSVRVVRIWEWNLNEWTVSLSTYARLIK